MVVAYVMVKANTGNASRLKHEIGTVDGVLESYIVAGDVDLIAKVDVESPGHVKDVVVTDIQEIDGVESTQTYIAMA